MAALLLTAGLPMPASAAAAAPPAPTAPVPPSTVTLITGDRVTLTPTGGLTAVQIDPAPGRERMVFHRSESGGHAVVIPDDAMPALASKQLDAGLFDVTELISQGYDDARRPDLPLLLTGQAPAGLSVSKNLPKTGFTAAKLSKKDTKPLWPLPAGQKVWLDSRVQASLDRSVPMIGAPKAWEAGLRGAGVKVAVLDTGYDATHPDLVVSASKGFTDAGEADVTDRVGHGTHVASTIAGRGAKYTGVAPDADLIVGKVLDDSGSGSFSSIIAGMEWAAASGARVVNMSLGSDFPSDGSDILSQTVNDLAAKTGTLFVTAAGNAGRSRSVSAPGAADAALTVASVTKDSVLSDFSSRGPRIGDDAIKPEISAPGSDITAARAAGTPGEGLYATHSGTSMATPHVAGAAALLAQRNPKWNASDLKSALVTNAKPIANQPIYAQGGGIVDIPGALGAKVTADVSTVSFGIVPAPTPGSPTQQKNVIYRNDGDNPVTVNLVATSDAPAGLFSVSPATLTVPAHGTAQATVTLTPSAGKAGLFGGGIQSTIDGAAGPQVLIGASVDVEQYQLHITTLQRDGTKADFPDLIVANQDGSYVRRLFPQPGGANVRLPKGSYTVVGNLVDQDKFGVPTAVTSLATSEIEVNKDTEVLLDAREGKPVKAEVDGDPDSRPQDRSDGVGVAFDNNLGFMTNMDGPADLPFYATPAKNPRVVYYSQQEWARPRTTLRAVKGADRFDVPVRYGLHSPPITNELNAGTVDGKDGRPEDIAGLDLHGKIVLVRTGDNPSGQAATVAQAGAAAVVFSATRFGVYLPQPTSIPVVEAGLGFDRLLGAATAQLRGYDVSPSAYHLMFTAKGEVPAGRTYRVGKRDLVAVDTDYRSTGGHGRADMTALTRPPASGFSRVFQVEAKLPMRRVEYHTPGVWSHWVQAEGAGNAQLDSRTGYELGRTYRSVWWRGVFSPRLDTWDIPPVSRTGNAIRSYIRLWSGASSWQYPSPFMADTGSTTLSINGKPLNTTEKPGQGQWDNLPAEPADYELTAVGKRDMPGWSLSTEVRASWRFRSAAGSNGIVPLLDIKYDVALDENNRANGPFTLSVQRPNSTGAVKVKSLKVQASLDGGKAWRDLRAVQWGDCWLVQPAGGHAGQDVSLRVTAEDTDGNSVDQTLINAYHVK